MTLVEFLLARIAEDEAADGFSKYGEEPEAWCDRADGAHLGHGRWQAECEAKRQIVRLCATETALTGGKPLAIRTLHLLSRPYADHPDYRQEWKP